MIGAFVSVAEAPFEVEVLVGRVILRLTPAFAVGGVFATFTTVKDISVEYQLKSAVLALMAVPPIVKACVIRG